MESQDLRLAMIQWVEHFERLGVRYLPKPNEIEPDLLAEWFTTESAAEPTVQPRIQTPPISNAQPSPSPTSTPSAIPRPSPTPKPVADQSSGTWKTSPLALDERTRAMDNLRTQVAACKLCTDLACRRQNTVFGVGPLNTRFVMVGEAPGADEDRIGEPFVGAAGQLLDKILIATEIGRAHV